MIPKLEESFKNLLEECGFIEEGQAASGLINSELAKEKVTTYLRYRSLLKETDVYTDLIYEVPSPTDEIPGTPCIYFKFTDTPTNEIVNQLRTKIWNHGRIPTLWIVTPDAVRIYNSFARPQPDDVKNSRNHLLGELSSIEQKLKNVEEFHKSKFDTGEFWRTGQGRKVNPDQRVDSALLRDLTTTERLLVDKKLDSTTAHALLGRAIFVKYLEDRKIIKPASFHTYKCTEFKGLLGDKEKTYSFFEWLRNTFNGDLFPLTPREKKDVQSDHLDILYRFLSGHDMKAFPTTQPRLWPYSFNIIPIELISSIYEMFAHAKDPKKAEAMSIHYTRFNLVELVLSLGMKNIQSKARILDPACGSGVFLVEAFRRLVWLKEKECGCALNREELHEILQKQIFGMDKDPDAVYVAAFSLYLALLELDPDPQPPDALRFPPLLDNNQQDKQPANLYIQDFFNIEHDFNHNFPFSNGGFDLISGNPPWTALKKPKNSEDQEITDRQWDLEYCRKENIPDNKPDQAFMWRARNFLNPSNPDACVAFIVSSRLFYQMSTTAQPWREKFLATNTVDKVVNLSDLSSENILFGRESSAGLPASVVIFSPKQPHVHGSVIYVTPKWYPGIRKRDEILIAGDDIQTLPQNLLKENPLLWKTAFWGTPRDFRLIQRLCSFKSLEQVLSDENVKRREHRSYGLTFGDNPTKNASKLRNLPFLESGSTSRYKISINDFKRFDRPFIAQKSNNRPLQLPVLILNRALRNAKPCAAIVESSPSHDRVIFDHMYYGISFGHILGSLIYRLNAILNSKCVYYLAFMLSTSLGWDWRTIEPNTWMQIPMPPSISSNEDSRWNDILKQEKWLRENLQTYSSDPIFSHAEDLIDNGVYELYDLSEQEIILVEDTLKFTILPLLQRKKVKGRLPGTEEPTKQQLVKYAQRICTQLNGILHQGNFELEATVFDIQNVPLMAIRFNLRERSNSPLVASSQIVGIKDIFEQISDHLRSKIADHLYVQRNLRIYDDKTFWIFKLNESRAWSEAAAINDADSVVREHMEQLLNG